MIQVRSPTPDVWSSGSIRLDFSRRDPQQQERAAPSSPDKRRKAWGTIAIAKIALAVPAPANLASASSNRTGGVVRLDLDAPRVGEPSDSDGYVGARGRSVAKLTVCAVAPAHHGSAVSNRTRGVAADRDRIRQAADRDWHGAARVGAVAELTIAAIARAPHSSVLQHAQVLLDPDETPITFVRCDDGEQTHPAFALGALQEVEPERTAQQVCPRAKGARAASDFRILGPPSKTRATACCCSTSIPSTSRSSSKAH